MLEKIKSYSKHPLARQLSDSRSLGLMLFGIIAIMVTWSGVKAVQTNYTLQKQIAQMEQQNQLQSLTNNNLKLQNQYLNSNQFLELSARREFGLAAPGEQEVIVPKNVALAHTVDLTKDKSATEDTNSVQRPTYQKNFQAWVDFFLHRPHEQN